MKLKELLDEIFKDGPIEQEKFGIIDYTLYGKKHLELIKDKLLQLEEFSELDELTILDHPTYEIDGNVYTTNTYKLVEGQKFGGKGFLLSVSLTPETYDPDTIHTPVKDGACISQTVYDPETFEPFKKIVLQFSPERIQDGISNHENLIRQELHELLDKILDNPQDYQVKGERHVLVRGVFETNEVRKSVESPKYLSGIKTNPEHFTVYYFEQKNINEGEIKMDLKTKFIPKELKDKFIEEFGDRVRELKLTGEEIDKFLNDNKV